MTPTDELLDDAFRRADVRPPAAPLDPVDCAPDVFERLLRHEDARVRSLGSALLGERIVSDQPAAFAALLPAALSAAGDWAVAENALVAAERYARLGPHVPKPHAVAGHAPPWRTAGLPVRVQIAWLRAEGQGRAAGSLVLVDGPLRDPAAAVEEERTT